MTLNIDTWKEDRCPRCFSFDIEHENLEVFTDPNRGMRKGLCNNCGLAFGRIYDLQYDFNWATQEKEIIIEEFDHNDWSGAFPDKRFSVEIYPFAIASRSRISFHEFEEAKYDLAERMGQREEEFLRMEKEIYEKAAQLGIYWIPFEKATSWWKPWRRESGFVVVNPIMEHKDGTYHKVECRENELKSLLEAFIRRQA